MANEEQVLDDVVEQEEQDIETLEDQELDSPDGDDDSENSITLSKSDYKKLDRQARAYQASKSQREEKPLPTKKAEGIDPDSVIETISALRNIQDDEISVLESEASTLGVPLIKYVKSESGKTLLKNIRDEKKSKDANPNISTKSPVFKKHTVEDLNKMTAAELEKILPHA